MLQPEDPRPHGSNDSDEAEMNNVLYTTGTAVATSVTIATNATPSEAFHGHALTEAAAQPLTPPLQRTHAAQSVLATTELLEAILAHVSARDLLLVQRTSRSFRDTVQGSVRLRRKLFLEPDWTLQTCTGSDSDIGDRNKLAATTWWWRGAPRSFIALRPENNRLLLRAFPGCYPSITLVLDPAKGSRSRGGAGETQQLQHRRRRRRTENEDGSAPDVGGGSNSRGSAEGYQWNWDVCISFPAEQQSELRAAVLHPTASWRKMYISQPPCKDLYLVRGWRRSAKPAVSREDGITMGDFYAEATRPVPCCDDHLWHKSFISSDRDWHFEGSVRSRSLKGFDGACLA